MSYQTIQNSFVGGEISPSIWGRTDLAAKWHTGASTMRNFFVGYRGGAYSRAGLAYVGKCKQAGTSSPPRDIPFQFNVNQGYALEFGDQYMRIKQSGAYVTESTKAITGATKANPCVLTIAGHGYATGDWIYISGVGGMTALDGLAWIVYDAPDVNHIRITDLFGALVDSTTWNTYTSGGTAARIYTIATPYAAADLPYLKYTQSADSMTLCCVNQETLTEYQPYSLTRTGAASWTLTALSYASSITAPTGIATASQSSTTLSTWYSYVVTAVSQSGEESVASVPGAVENNDIAVYAGSNTIGWSPVAGASYYRIYKATPSYGVPVASGVNYGFLGTAFGSSFCDTNITADFTTTPPLHSDPFARGAITDVNPTAGGANYTQGTIGYTITTGTGTGFSGTPVVISGAFTSFIIENGGSGYIVGDTITITDSAIGAGATATLTIGEETGTYPSVPSYYQQRSVFANTLNQPDTYWMSRSGAYNNMDSAIPTIASDAIIGTPWAQQVNGVQFMQPMTSGLIILTGGGAWLLNGGTAGAAVTPSTQQATAQAFNGCSPIVPPLLVNYDLLYVQQKGSLVRDLTYNFFTNVYTGVDITIYSAHLFNDHKILQWCYAEEPFKMAWAVRDDGALLSMAFLKEQEVNGWSRHDTNGLCVGVCSITEPPVDAVYVIVKRYVNGGWHYYSERMDNRNWSSAEDSFCVDAGLKYPQTYPAATLTVSAASGSVTMTASSAVFSAANIGDVVRVGGGIITVTGYTSSTILTGTTTVTITDTIPNDPTNAPVPAVANNWSISTPVTTVSGLNHLIGKTVAIVADGGVVSNQVVSQLGHGLVGITLAYPASSIAVGLPFTAQLQTMYLDPAGQPVTVQSKRKTISSVAVRLEASRGLFVGTNQPDASIQPHADDVVWSLDDLKEIKQYGASITAGQPIPLYTGDYFINVPSNWDVKGQIAIQQSYPLPANVLSVVAYYNVGDSVG